MKGWNQNWSSCENNVSISISTSLCIQWISAPRERVEDIAWQEEQRERQDENQEERRRVELGRPVMHESTRLADTEVSGGSDLADVEGVTHNWNQ